MSSVFVSYKREDEVRVARLVRALEDEGFNVWSDAALAGAENWREQIQQALDAAGCVVVVWTAGSAGPGGDFVRDEASRARERGVLAPVRFDNVRPPLGFGEIQTVDLIRWRGDPRDPAFQDLVAVVRAKLAGRAAPPALGPRTRLMRRLRYAGLSTALAFGVAAFALNALRVQDRVCGAGVAQPALSDACGTLGLGNRPAKRERLAWENREPGSCDALRSYLAAYGAGVYRDRAAALLAARRMVRTEAWTPAARRLQLYVSQAGGARPDEDAARTDALARARDQAERLCKGFAAGTLFRLRSSSVEAQSWECSRTPGGVVCGFGGEAVCAVDERQTREIEQCETPGP
ncbi:MAG: toll/interleukin-1 receptor domain-containing protein [Acidobacteria bacterium]|nr:toll/interleukin-1 receptor domain-containing protein [Acidobacteriota bacterium]